MQYVDSLFTSASNGISYYLGYSQPVNPISSLAQDTLQETVSTPKILEIAKANLVREPEQEELERISEIYAAINPTELTSNEKDTLISAMLGHGSMNTALAISLIKQLTAKETSWYQIVKRTHFVMNLSNEERETLSFILRFNLSPEQLKTIIHLPTWNLNKDTNILESNDAYRLHYLKLISALLKCNSKETVFSDYKKLSDSDRNKAINFSDSGYHAFLIDGTVIVEATEDSLPSQK